MPPSLLPSQFATLEPLVEGEDGVVVVVDVPPEEVADRALAALGMAWERPTPDGAAPRPATGEGAGG